MLNRILIALYLAWLPFDVTADGPLLWEVRADIHGGLDIARAITLSGKVAIVVGNGGVPLEGTDQSEFVIQALGKASGALQWSDQTFLSAGSVEPLFLSSRQKRVYAVGTFRAPGDPRSALLVRSYDVRDGTLLWENLWHPDEGIDTDHPTGIVATATQVFVIGYGQNAAKNGLAALIRAHDAISGAILWEIRDSREDLEVIPWVAVANQNRVFVAGTTSPIGASTDLDLFVRAYDATSGALEWEAARNGTIPTQLAVTAGRLTVAGSSSGSTYL